MGEIPTIKTDDSVERLERLGPGRFEGAFPGNLEDFVNGEILRELTPLPARPETPLELPPAA